MRFIEKCFVATAVLMALLNCAAAEKPIKLETIPIPERDNLYQGLKSRLLRSEDDTNALIDDLFANNRRFSRHQWGDRSQDAYDQIRRASNQRIAKVRKALDDARIDYGSETVAVVFVTSGSGSIRFTVGAAHLEHDVLTLVIDKDSPGILTMDMAYRAFALCVPRDIAKRVRVPADRGIFRTYDLATGEEIVEDAGKSEVAPKAAASPQR